MDIDELPDLALEIVFSYLNQYDDLENVRLVNRRWYRAACTIINILKKAFLRCNQLNWELHTAQEEDESTIAKRCSHSGCYHDGTKKVYIFGGCTDNYTAFNDLWSFDLRSRSWCREIIKCSPFPRPKAMSVFVPYKEYLILHGGCAKSSPSPIHQAANFFSEIHMYDTITNEWIEIETEPPPPVIASHCACVVDDSLIIFGGSQNSRATNAVYVLDITSKIWHIPPFVQSRKDRTCAKSDSLSGEQFLLKSPQPNPRYGSSCVVIDKSHLLVVGGCGGPNCIYNDAWLLVFDLTLQTAWEWKQIIVGRIHCFLTRLEINHESKIGSVSALVSPSMSDWAKSCMYKLCWTEQWSFLNIWNGRSFRYSTISLNSYPAPLQVTSRNPVQLSRDRTNNVTLQPSYTSNLKHINAVPDVAFGIPRKKWYHKKRQGNACVYILDTTRVLKDCTVTWHQQEVDLNAPDDTMLYSLCAGRGELIMFGGMRSDMNGNNRHPFTHTISNDIYILSPHRLV